MEIKALDRKNTNSVKWDRMNMFFSNENIIPLWVADHDFAAPDELINQFNARIKHANFGYNAIHKNFYESVVKWQKLNFGWDISEDHVLPVPGVIATIGFMLQILTSVGDKVMLMSPVYGPFYQIIKTQSREVVDFQLKEKNNNYSIDFDRFEDENALGVKVLLLCNPHNPVGRVWSENELKRIVQICDKYGVKIISDEIHQDITYDRNHIPIASISDRAAEITITVSSPGKTFGITGLRSASVIVKDKEIKSKLIDILCAYGFHSATVFSALGLETCYVYGYEWLKNLIEKLKFNRSLIKQFVDKNNDKISLSPIEGTFLAWIDFRNLFNDQDLLNKFLIDKAKLALSPGTDFGEAGKCFARMNFGCSSDLLEKALTQLDKALYEL
jgi:cystathionine beta-lyase